MSGQRGGSPFGAWLPEDVRRFLLEAGPSVRVVQELIALVPEVTEDEITSFRYVAKKRMTLGPLLLRFSELPIFLSVPITLHVAGLSVEWGTIGAGEARLDGAGLLVKVRPGGQHDVRPQEVLAIEVREPRLVTACFEVMTFTPRSLNVE